MVYGGVRIEWTSVPAAVRREVEALLGAAVVHAETQSGGFSPGVAARCALADGRRCFIKAISSDPNPMSPHFHRREADVAAQLAAELPVPRLLSVYDDGEWVVLVFEEVDGQHPDLPWTMSGLAATFATLDRIGAAPAPKGVPSFVDMYTPILDGFRRLAGDRPSDGLDPWVADNLDRLADLESRWTDAAEGDGLLHTDVRADNLLVRSDGTVVLVDWPHACTGAAWIDKAGMLPSVGLDGPQPSDVEAALDPFEGVDPDQVTAVITALAGYFTYQGLLPDPPGLPTVRQFQRDQGAVACRWLAQRIS